MADQQERDKNAKPDLVIQHRSSINNYKGKKARKVIRMREHCLPWALHLCMRFAAIQNSGPSRTQIFHNAQSLIQHRSSVDNHKKNHQKDGEMPSLSTLLPHAHHDHSRWWNLVNAGIIPNTIWWCKAENWRTIVPKYSKKREIPSLDNHSLSLAMVAMTYFRFP